MNEEEGGREDKGETAEAPLLERRLFSHRSGVTAFSGRTMKERRRLVVVRLRRSRYLHATSIRYKTIVGADAAADKSGAGAAKTNGGNGRQDGEAES